MSNSQKLTAWGITFLVFVLCLYFLRDVLLPFVAGIALAYFLDPMTTKLQKKLHSRIAAVTIISCAAVLIFLMCIFIVVPIIQRQFTTFITNIPVYAVMLWRKLEPHVENLKEIFPEQMDNLQQRISEHFSGGVKIIIKTVQGILSRSMAILNLLSLLIITPIVAFYMLRDWQKFRDSMNSLLPLDEAKTIRKLIYQINDIISGFVRGQATVCLVLGVFYAVGLTLVGLDLGLLIGLGIGILSFIPYVGSTIGFILSVGLACVQFDSWHRVLAVAIVFFVGQMMEGNVLTPKLIGDKVGLHAVWVMFALLAGGTLFGFLGVLIAVPVAAVIGVLVRFGIQKYKESALYLGGVQVENGCK